MCKKMTFLLMLAFILMSLPAVADITISRVEPANWWIGMKKTEFQILVYGPNIGRSKVLIHYPGVTLKEAARVESPNYIFLYVNIASGT